MWFCFQLFIMVSCVLCYEKELGLQLMDVVPQCKRNVAFLFLFFVFKERSDYF